MIMKPFAYVFGEVCVHKCGSFKVQYTNLKFLNATWSIKRSLFRNMGVYKIDVLHIFK